MIKVLRNVSMLIIPLTISCFVLTAEGADKIIMKSASATAGAGAPYYVGHRYMKERIEQLTDNIEVQIGYGTLGGERQLIEGLQMGTVEAACVTTSPLGNFVQETMIFDLPFIFKNVEHLHRTLDGAYGERIKKRALEKGLRILGYWQLGRRNIYYNHTKPVVSPPDLKNVKMRVIESPVFLELYKAYGANPVPMPWPDCYVALKQGAIDGVDSVMSYASKINHHEVVKYATLLNHIFSIGPLIVSERWWKTLSPSLQDVIIQAEFEARHIERQADTKASLEDLEVWKKAGVKLVEPDIEEFRKIAFSIYPKFEEEFGAENIAWIKAVGEMPEFNP
jgi:tripartite ATP-independent transporter DctP family solute receptor